jgi:DNA-binding NtrC family response regulator
VSDATLQLDPRRRGALSMQGVRLLVLRGPDKGRALSLEREEAVVGSAESADLRLTDPAVSRSHFALRAVAEGWRLDDLESTNGTFLDGRRVVSAFLKPGDAVEAGRSRIRLEETRKRVELALSAHEAFGKLIGRSAVAKRLFALLEQVAPEASTVLLTGETGTGKDTAAEALHEASPRAGGPFVAVDCGAIPAGLVESELFGHERGSFTGATEKRIGALAEANGGTLFLDEIGELPRPLQPKLLRAIEEREVRPVGASKPVKIDVRIIAATNRDLRLEVNRGLFREDLFYRLNVISIRVPALRERVEDIPLLAEHFRRQLSGDGGGMLPQATLDALSAAPWPGNVRELRNRIERMVALERYDPTLETRADQVGEPSFHQERERVLDEFERRFVGELLARTGGNASEAARRAGMNRVYLARLIRKHRLR